MVATPFVLRTKGDDDDPLPDIPDTPPLPDVPETPPLPPVPDTPPIEE